MPSPRHIAPNSYVCVLVHAAIILPPYSLPLGHNGDGQMVLRITVFRALLLAIFVLSLAWWLLDPHEPFHFDEQGHVTEPYSPIISPDRTP